MGRIQLLDCTLRDGGYINDWRFGESAIKDITDKMVQSGVDIVEIGFLKDEPYQKDRCIFNSMEQVKKVIGKKKDGVKYAVMCEVVNPLPLELLAPADKDSADIIRVIIWKTKHDEKGNAVDALQEGFEYCKGIVEKGYKLCVQPARVSQYSDEEFVAMVKKFSILDPLAIYVVDSWGTQNPEGLLHYMHLADKNMPENIFLGYHGHNNMMQALSAAQAMIHEKFQRDIVVDASVYGIGRGAGNLNIEIIAQYINEQFHEKYNILSMTQVYKMYIKYIYAIKPWGYSIPYQLTAIYNCNPNYVPLALEYMVNEIELKEILCRLNDIDKVIVNRDNFKEQLYFVRKKKLCIIVPTYNRRDVIKIWIEYFAEEYACYGVDLIIYDSSDNSEIEELIKKCGKKNVFYYRYSVVPKFPNAIDEKVRDAYFYAHTKYKYVWICRDRSIPKIKNIYSAFLDMMDKDKDALYVYPHWSNTKLKGDYTSHCEFIIQYGNMTSLGAIIYSSRILAEMLEMCPVTKLGLWTPDALFHVIAGRKFCVGFIKDDNFYYIPYTNSSFWIKNGSSDKLWLELWPQIVNNLPDVYNCVKSELRRFIGWDLPPFLPYMILPARASGSYSFTTIIKNFHGLWQSGKKNTLRIIGISLLPPMLVEFGIKSKNTVGMKLLKFIFSNILRKIFIFFRALMLNIYKWIIDFLRLLSGSKRIKNTESILNLERIDNISINKNIKSFLLYKGKSKKIPWITVVIPTYCRKEKLEEAIISLKIQKEVDFYWDIVIVDNEPYNGKKNETQLYVEKLNWDKVTYYRNEKNLNVGGNMNRGVYLARGTWVAMLHDDDLLIPDYFEKMEKRIHAAEKYSKKEVAMISDVHNVCGQDLSLKNIEKRKQYIVNEMMRSLTDDNILLPVVPMEYLMTGGCGVGTPTAGTLYSRKCFLEIGGFNDSNTLSDDAVFAYSLTKKYAVYRSNYTMGYYRQGDNITKTHVKQIIKDIVHVRDKIFQSCIAGKILGYFIREEYVNRDIDYVNQLTGGGVHWYDFTDLTHYRSNIFRKKIIAILTKLYFFYQKKNAISCITKK